MKILVINLDRMPARLEHAKAVFSAAGLSFSRVAAVDGRDLGADEIARWRRARPDRPPISPGEVACFLSHRKCWEVAVDAGEPVAIFEDDIHLGRDASRFLDRTDWIPPDADLVKIETDLRPTLVDKKPFADVASRTLVRLRGVHLNCGGYLVAPGAAARLLDESRNFSVAADHVLFDPAAGLFRSMTIYQLTPAICAQHGVLYGDAPGDLQSSLQPERRRKRRTGLDKLRREAVRPFEQFFNLLASFATNQMNGWKRVRVPFE